jgi:Ca2+/Na+ antiporter
VCVCVVCVCVWCACLCVVYVCVYLKESETDEIQEKINPELL